MTTNAFLELINIWRHLYSILVALALANGLRLVVTPDGASPKGPFEIAVGPVYLFLALVLTAIPFYHGTILYTVNTYKLNSIRQKNTGALLFDLLVLLFQGALLFVMSLSVSSVDAFLAWFELLLIVDVVFVGIALLRNERPPWIWPVLNLSLFLFLLIFPPLFAVTWIPLGVFVLALLRSLFDYSFAWRYYAAHTPTEGA